MNSEKALNWMKNHILKTVHDDFAYSYYWNGKYIGKLYSNERWTEEEFIKHFENCTFEWF
ncbi:hypothetical protein IKN40_06770 [bacterium]|nr:hypothetical protein [bacterium]